jgi:hypothetical protein
MPINLHPSFAVHPGPSLRAEIIEPRGFSVAVAAQRPCAMRSVTSNLNNGFSRFTA